MTTGEPILSGISFSILTIKPKIMLFVSTIAVALLLAVSAKAETKTATKVLTSTEKALAAVQANDQVQMKMTKSREQMIAKYADGKLITCVHLELRTVAPSHISFLLL